MKVQEIQVRFLLIVFLFIVVTVFRTNSGYAQEKAPKQPVEPAKPTPTLKIPLDKYGLVDWVKLKEKGLIDPKWTLDPNPEEEEEEDETVIFFESKSVDMEDVLFSHTVHTDYLNCDSCHDNKGGKLFEDSAGGNKVVMRNMRSEGQWCGRCHSTVAFPLKDCKRCHNVPKGAPVDEDWSLREEE